MPRRFYATYRWVASTLFYFYLYIFLALLKIFIQYHTIIQHNIMIISGELWKKNSSRENYFTKPKIGLVLDIAFWFFLRCKLLIIFKFYRTCCPQISIHLTHFIFYNKLKQNITLNLRNICRFVVCFKKKCYLKNHSIF